MEEKEITELAARLHKFYETFKKNLSASERHGLMKSYLTLEFFIQYQPRKNSKVIDITPE